MIYLRLMLDNALLWHETSLTAGHCRLLLSDAAMTFQPILATERRLSLFGLDARYTGATVRHNEKAGCFCRQTIILGRDLPASAGYGSGARMSVELRFDDQCSNGHNTFYVTAEISTTASRRRNDIEAGGCLHDEIARYFPALAHLIKWHGTTSEGPLHYVANTLYFAGDADYNGRKAGEISATARGIRFGNSPITQKISHGLAAFLESRMNTGEFQPVAIAYEKRPGDTYNFQPKWTLAGYGERWHECPFDREQEAREWCAALNSGAVELVTIPTAYSEGKSRELDAARRAAVWPEATDAELCQPREELQKALEARLPALLAAFRAHVETCGFAWSPESLAMVGGAK